jgi:hypothetical protein
MANGGGQLNMPHPLTADFGAGDFYAAALADNALVLNLLVATARAFPVLYRTEYLLAKQPVALWPERTVVDGFGLLDLAVRPRKDVFAACDTDPDFVKNIDVWH